jgi:hypothetical protein
MRPIQLALILCVPLLVPACDSGPCSGGGMEEDKRALPEAWAKSAPPAAGAIACHSADGSTDQEFERSYEGGKSPKEGFDLWNGHLTGKGWKATGETKDDDVYHQETYELDGAKIALQCSKRTPDKGWCTLAFTPKG